MWSLMFEATPAGSILAAALQHLSLPLFRHNEKVFLDIFIRDVLLMVGGLRHQRWDGKTLS